MGPERINMGAETGVLRYQHGAGQNSVRHTGSERNIFDAANGGRQQLSLDERYAAILKEYGLESSSNNYTIIENPAEFLQTAPRSNNPPVKQEPAVQTSVKKAEAPAAPKIPAEQASAPAVKQQTEPAAVPKPAVSKPSGQPAPETFSGNVFPKTIEIMIGNMENISDFGSISEELVKTAAGKGLKGAEAQSWLNASILVELASKQKAQSPAKFNNEYLSEIVSNSRIPNGSEDYNKMMDEILEGLKPKPAEPETAETAEDITEELSELPVSSKKTDDVSASKKSAERNQTAAENTDTETEFRFSRTVPNSRVVRQKKSGSETA